MIKSSFLVILFGFLLFYKETALFGVERETIKLQLGQVRNKDYFGPHFPQIVRGTLGKPYVFLDDFRYSHFLEKEFGLDIFKLNHFWNEEVLTQAGCPNFYFNESYDFIHYAFRLTIMSYLYEYLKMNRALASKLGDNNSCRVEFEQVFQSCRPKTADMKNFYNRARIKLSDEIFPKPTPLIGRELENWFSQFKNVQEVSGLPAEKSLWQFCQQNGKNCSRMQVAEIISTLNELCTESKNEMNAICSEEDQYFGLYNERTALDLIMGSNLFGIIDRSGRGEECLWRFIDVNKDREFIVSQIYKIFPSIFSDLLKSKGPNLQGELFLPGALKEFDEKGLVNLINILKIPKEKSPAPILKAPVKKIIPSPVVVLNISSAPMKEAKVTWPTPVETPMYPVSVLSEFESKVLELAQSFEKEEVSLNMEIFHNDFEFTSAILSEKAEVARKYQTRSALAYLKKQDKLGSIVAPMSLIFIKFLIETQNHQGLYNILNVLGEKFYVINDLENKDVAHHVSLKNDESTSNRWQITLHKN